MRLCRIGLSSAYYRITGKLQQQLLGAGILKGDSGLDILATAFHLDDGADAKALVLYHVAFLQPDIDCGRGASLRSGTSRGFTSATNWVATGRGFCTGRR